MLDKFTIGPVTIVQLVGLNAKPRITSAQVDGAVRAADPIPPSAAAGLGDGLSKPLDELEASSLGLKAAPVLGLSADPVRAHISLESGVDRPIAGASAPAPAIDPSTFDLLLPNNPPGVSGRDSPPPAADIPNGGDTKTTAPVVAPEEGSVADPAPDLGYVFDGAESFGDDQILDFTIVIDSSISYQAGTASVIESIEISAVFSVSELSQSAGLSAIDFSGHTAQVEAMIHDDFIATQDQISATDAVTLI